MKIDRAIKILDGELVTWYCTEAYKMGASALKLIREALGLNPASLGRAVIELNIDDVKKHVKSGGTLGKTTQYLWDVIKDDLEIEQTNNESEKENQKMKIKSKPIGEWTVQELKNFCDKVPCRECPLMDGWCNYGAINPERTIDYEIPERDYELLKIVKRIFELSDIDPKTVTIKSSGNGKLVYEYSDKINSILTSALFDINLPQREYSFADLGIK